MELILTDEYGRDVRDISDFDADFEVGDENDFQLTISTGDWCDDFSEGKRVYIPGTEFGGIIKRLEEDTEQEEIYPGGRTWRGMLCKKIICPASGQDYKTVSGELNSIIKSLVEPEFPGLFYVVTDSTGVTLSSFRFDRYCTLYDGLTKMLDSKGYRLSIKYKQREKGDSGYVEIAAVPKQDISEQIELSSDSRLNFMIDIVNDATNHLICLGKGELKDRLVVHLYVQVDGSIGTTPYYTGIDEVVEVYEMTTDDAAELESRGRDRLADRTNSQDFKMAVDDLSFEVEIGDIIGGRDYVTGTYIKEPVNVKILKIEDGISAIEYKIGDN